MFGRGKRQVDVAAKLGVSQPTASRWYQLWQAGGRAALAGAFPRTSASQMGRARRRQHRPGRPPGAEGAIVVRLRMPPGALLTLWNDDDRFRASYLSAFDGQDLTGDGGRTDADGYVIVLGCTDDVSNVAGHRLSAGGMEEVLATHPDVAECAVIGVHDSQKGQIPRGFVVLKTGVDADADGYPDRLRAGIVQMVCDRIGAIASLKDVAIVAGAAPRPARGRSFARPCGGSPTASMNRSLPRSTTPACPTLRPVLCGH